MQKICSLGIEDYKKESGKYRIGEKNGKGKEFIIYKDILIFEGKYKNLKEMEKEKNIIIMVN